MNRRMSVAAFTEGGDEPIEDSRIFAVAQSAEVFWIALYPFLPLWLAKPSKPPSRRLANPVAVRPRIVELV